MALTLEVFFVYSVVINAANTDNVVNFIDLLVSNKFSLCARFMFTITESIISILYENHPFPSVTEPLIS